MVTADFDDYFATQRRIDKLWLSPSDWTRMCIMNIAHMAWFSSDRAIGEYAQEIWHVPVTDARRARAPERAKEHPDGRPASDGCHIGMQFANPRHAPGDAAIC